MVEVQADHFSSAARSAPGFDGTSGAVANFEERHKPGRRAAARQQLPFAPNSGKVGAHTGAVLENTGFAHPQVHDAAVADQVISHRQDETGVRLRPLVGRRRLLDLAGLRLHKIVALWLAGNAVCGVKARVEPLGRIRSGHLIGDHVGQLVVENLAVLGAGEIAVAAAPILPAGRHAVSHLFDGGFAACAAIGLGHPGFAEVFLCENVCSHLAPSLGNFHVVSLKHHVSAGVADHRGTLFILEQVKGTYAFFGETAGKTKTAMNCVGLGHILKAFKGKKIGLSLLISKNPGG